MCRTRVAEGGWHLADKYAAFDMGGSVLDFPKVGARPPLPPLLAPDEIEKSS